MTQILKADVSVKVIIGPVVAVGDGFTPVTTLSLSTADEAELMKHDAAAVTDISGNTFAAITSMDGYYNLTLTAAQLDTEGMLTIGINDDSLCLPVMARFMVVNANVYDSLYAAATTDYLQVDTVQSGGTTQTANDNGADINSLLTNLATAQTDLDTLTGSDGVTLATSQPNYAPAVAGNSMALTAAAVDAIWDEAIAGHLTAGTSGLYLALAGAVLQDTTITGTPTSTTFQLTAGSTVDNFYNDQVIYILSGTGIGQARPISDYTGATKTVTVDEAWITTPAASDRVAILSSHVHPLSQIRAEIDANSTQLAAILEDTAEIGAAGAGLTAIAQASVCTEARLSELDAATGGKMANQVDIIQTDTTTDIPAQISALNNLSSAQAQTAAAAALTAYDPPTNAEMEARTPTAAQLAYIVSNAADGLPVTFTGGTTTTAILGNVDGAAASSTDDVYNGRILVFNAGTLDQQVTDITDYVGATKTCTITAVTTSVTSAHTANMK